MKSVIVFYSFSGNTRKVANVLAEYLRQQGPVDIIDIKALDESDKFLEQAKRAFWKKRGQIEPVNYDVSAYDLVCIGTPTWAFGPAPAMNTFLDNISGVEDKETLVFTTYGSGAGNNHCLKAMQKLLLGKGAQSCKRFTVQQFKVDDVEHIRGKIKEGFVAAK